MDLNAGGFQCPDNGVPCVLLFDEDAETVYAEVENNGFDYQEEEIKEAEEWCRKFGVRTCASFEEACWVCDKIEQGSMA